MTARQLAERAGVSHTVVVQAEAGRAVRRQALAGLVRVLGPAVYDAVSVWPPMPGDRTAVAAARRASGNTLGQAAARAGVSRYVFRRAEVGLRVYPANAKKIADAFGLDVADVLSLPDRNHGPADERAARAALRPHTGNVSASPVQPPLGKR